MKIHRIESPSARLAKLQDKKACWLWCADCRHFFQYSAIADTEKCPFFDNCGGVFGGGLFFWNDMREPQDPRWPSSVSELHHGLQSPDMETFYESQLANRIGMTLSNFAESPESARFAGTERYIGIFLKMMSDMCSDLTDPGVPFGLVNDHGLEFVDQLPVWAREATVLEAARMVDELRAFFDFASRTACISAHEDWLAVGSSKELEPALIHTMMTDKRLANV